MQISDALPARVRAGLFALLAGVLCLPSFPARADDLQEATKLLKSGQQQQALDRVNRILAVRPRDPQARFLKGVILTDQGSMREAIEIFTKLTQEYPELPEPYNNLAVIYASQGQYEKARTALEQSIRTHPSYATAYENLGDVYAKLASQAYDKALQLDSSNAAAQNKLSLVRDLVGAPQAPATKEAVQPPPAVVAQKGPEKPAPVEKPPVAEKPAAVEKPAVKAAEKPAEKPSASPEIVQAVNAWAQAWSKKDADAYFSHYAPGFQAPKGEPRARWERDRRIRITAPKSIAVSIASPKVTMADANHARVTFRQTYRSEVFKGTSTKTMEMVKSADGRWLIQQERTN
jgi:tetratricopeptide (TPR) repeat protein